MCLHLLREGHQIHVIDNLSTGYIESIERVKKISQSSLGFTECDIKSYNQLEKVFDRFRPDAVIHFAGLKSVKESVLNPLLYWDINLLGSINLLKVMNENKSVVQAMKETQFPEKSLLWAESYWNKKPFNVS